MTLAVEVNGAATTVADAVEQAARQPYEYVRRELVEPDWRRFPGWRDVTEAQWRDAQWQRVHCVKNIKQLRTLMGDRLDERFYTDLAKDQEQLATMSMLVPPQMLNTMVPGADE
ncbi:MAG TPA: lysine 2,3-aminomutase, partial [Pseudonocardiaceae bacterium]|nr:lysine 2,3-aminomutase [Pseudonocardiaceae bacterium]